MRWLMFVRLGRGVSVAYRFTACRGRHALQGGGTWSKNFLVYSSLKFLAAVDKSFFKTMNFDKSKFLC